MLFFAPELYLKPKTKAYCVDNTELTKTNHILKQKSVIYLCKLLIQKLL